ncbi:MAG: hypothetical protein AVDCRST_MAG95-1915 [uncultured Adhaeribacter sp.]|uniref:Uncharacterized protein n=1 Tax=uncultured Adhaeribacter sp. TaxID=448109 RepID=A0A6J4IHM1_9BACT|nr:MAG: hypothetical protein AVDCRST_MAG95-1915 [uncultured Adhaeribacter sp.]
MITISRGLAYAGRRPADKNHEQGRSRQHKYILELNGSTCKV